MNKIIAALALFLLSFAALAHKDRVLPIQPDGSLGGLPSQYGPTKVLIERSKRDPQSISSVELLAPRFHIKLSPCVVAKLTNIIHVEASGSWYHDLSRLPPYVSLEFYTAPHKPRSPTNEYYSITFSLVDGRILDGWRYWDPWWGDWRGQGIRPADKCSAWRTASLWSNTAFKPNSFRSTNSVAEKACHAVCSATRVGLT